MIFISRVVVNLGHVMIVNLMEFWVEKPLVYVVVQLIEPLHLVREIIVNGITEPGKDQIFSI